jgi:ABC-2 type transport system ATP-binding protein
MIGGSYGGEIQFAAAGIDPRIDTIIPLITWNDLAYSLAPNNAGDDHGVTSYVPGAFKYEWSSLFFADGIITGLEGVKVDPTRMAGCPNFDNRVCTAAIAAGVTGAPNDAMLTFVRHASVESYMQRIRIPTLLMQGQADTLFNLNESIATYDALRARHVPVKLVWQSWGHSHGPAPGEFDLGHPEGNPDGRIIIGWLNHYLKRSGPAPALDFSYFRDWVSYKGDAAPAYARSARYPVGGTRSLYLSGDGTLASDAGAVHAGTRTLLTTAAGAPTSYTETSALDQSLPVTDVPGTTVSFVGAPLPTDTDVVGIPTLDVRLSAPIHSLLGNAGGAPAEAVLFFRLEDIAPNGSVTLTHRLIAPARIALPDNEVHVQLPGIVHRFAKGHRFALVLAGGDAAYRGSIIAAPVSVLTDRANPGVLHIPVIAARSQLPVP